jgi:septal ring factor EnvC (AmiA/AmiB activator)
MPTVLDRQAAVDREAAELRTELADLQGAIASLSETLARTDRARGGAEAELARHRAMLGEALDLRAALEYRLVELEAELRRQRLVSVIRGHLLADILRSRPWRRGVALRRAGRVEALLGRTRAGS